jgi:hypothetical protein
MTISLKNNNFKSKIERAGKIAKINEIKVIVRGF